MTGVRAPLLPDEPAASAPTWVEWSITAGGFALFALLITVFVKFFPIMAVWEMTEERKATTGVAEPTSVGSGETP